VSVVSLEAGWVVTEVGRQPWTVVGLLLTRDASATSGNIWLFFAGTLVIYAAIGAGAVAALRIMHWRWRTRADEEVGVPYGPEEPVGGTVAEVRRP
jgi:cytochrome d ubiquinol oxidase subunit I